MVIDPVFLKSSGVIILFGVFFIPLVYLLNKKLKIPVDIGIVPAGIFIYLLLVIFVYGLNFRTNPDEFMYIIRQLSKAPITQLVLPISFLVVSLTAFFFLAGKLSQQVYRSTAHIIPGIFFLYFLLVSINLTFVALALAIVMFCSAEYLRKCGDGGRVSSYAKTILTRALRDTESGGFIASLLWLVGVLVVAFFLYPIRLEYAIGPVAILAFADPAGALIGKKYGRHKWTTNPNKSLEGSAGLFVIAIIALMLVNLVPGCKISVITAVVVALAVAIIESLPLTIGDNVIIPLIAGMVMLSGVASSLIELDIKFWVYAIVIGFLVGVFIYNSKILKPTGIGIAIFFGILIARSSSAGPVLMLAILIFLALGSLLTKFEYDSRKRLEMGKAEESKLTSFKAFFVRQWERIRGVARTSEGSWELNPVVANGIIPSFMAILYSFNPVISLNLFTGALAAALADTAVTGIGPALAGLDKNPVMLVTGARVPARTGRGKPGTRGAISWPGEIVAVLGALGMGGIVIALAIFLLPSFPAGTTVSKLLLIAGVGGIVGCNVDSLLGSFRFLSREEVNLFGTLSGAAVALLLTI